MRACLLGGLLWSGCKEDEEPSSESTADSEPIGACGELSSFDVTVVGRVKDLDNQWVAGVNVALEERNWSPGTIHGASVSDGDGAFSFAASGLPVVEDCWGTAVQYWLVGASGALAGEKPMNPLMVDAYESGLGVVDLGEFPLILR